MKLKSKSLFIIGLTGLLTLAIIFLIQGRISLPLLLIFIASLAVIFMATKLYILKRIEKLKEETNYISYNNEFTRRIELTNNDEITSIQSSFNVLLNNIEAINQEIENQVKEKLLEIQTSSAGKREPDLISPTLVSSAMIGHKDSLTALPNGVFFNEILNKAINHAKRRNQILAILLIDVDAFKAINEKFGSLNGDLILKELGTRFTNVLRKEDVLAKLKGDRFIVLLTDVKKPKFASMVAEKLLHISSQTLKIDETEFNLTTSIAISIFPSDGESLENLIESAEKALFKAKQGGGNSYQFATEEMHIEALEYIQLESALRKALHNNELALYYQPIFRIKTGNISGVEALLRWEHPVLGIIDPTKFVQLAEDSGLIVKIGEWALREVAHRIKYWQNAGYPHVSVFLKLSPKQFHHPDIDTIIGKALASVQINPKFIELEITEKTLMENVELTKNILNKIKSTGVQISIDHFGTGYTSINYLKQFPISHIKIDKSFIKGLPNHPDDMAITSAMIALSHTLGLEVIAEGVETAEQIQYLSSQNCDLVQGYFLSHPVSNQKIILQFKKLREEVLV